MKFWVVVAAAAAAVVAAGWVWSLGIANPEISSNAATYGGDGPVHMGFQITSDSSTTIEITEGFGVPSGLRLLGYTTGPFDIDAPPDSFRSDIFPRRLEAGDMVELTAFYEVDDCSRLPLGDDGVEVTVAIADGPFSRFEHRRQVSNDIFVSYGPGRGSWPATIAQFVCDADSGSIDE
ncbi:MAG: hypothetical protein RIB98_17310 [Acidimicrobiales bacterium]